MDRTASWWLKLLRAHEHLEQIEGELRRYSDSHPYRAIRTRQPDQDSYHWRFELVMTDKPKPELGVMIGDFFHNLRAALDHVVSAHVPPTRRDASSFPIRLHDPWEQDSRGRYIRPDKARRSFDNAVAGLSSNAVALIKDLQPYRRGPANPNDPKAVYKDVLAVVSKIDNIDKHRQVTTTLEGVESVRTQVLISGNDVSDRLRADGALLETNTPERMVKTDTPVTMFIANSPDMPESEVQVNVSGTAVVAVYVEDFGVYYRTPVTLRGAMDYVGDKVLLPFLAVYDEGHPPAAG